MGRREISTPPRRYAMSDEKELTKDIAKQFAADNNSVDLSEFTEIENAAAESLSKHTGDWLYLDGLIGLSHAAVESLSKYRGYLSLAGLTFISDAEADADALASAGFGTDEDYGGCNDYGCEF